MPFFRDEAQLYEVLGGFFRRCRENPDVGPKVGASGILVQFRYDEPEAVITINAKTPQTPPFDVIVGPTDIQPDLSMKMKADLAHEFWLGRVNLLAALAGGQIVADGPIMVALKLLPALTPAFALYRQYLGEAGVDAGIPG